jgi:ribosomal protein S18 acetylase RimI-like enzyme
LTEPVLEKISTEVVCRAVEENRAEWRHRASAWPGIEFVEWPDMVLYMTGINSPWFNGATRTKIATGREEERVAAALKRLEAERLPLSWTVGPSTEPQNLGKYLEAAGFKAGETGPVMAVDLSEWLGVEVPSNVTIDEVTDYDTLRIYGAVLMPVFDIPYPAAQGAIEEYEAIGYGPDGPMRLLLAEFEGKPAATSMVFFGGGIAWIDDVAVAPEARRRGLGAALVGSVMNLARESGYRVGVLCSSEMGVGLYKKLGFSEYGNWTTYIREAGGIARNL